MSTSKIDAINNFTTTQIDEMNELITVNEELKKLEAKKQILSDNIKRHMINAKIDKVDVNGSTLSLIESTRKTIKKATKDEFIAELIGKNKKHLVTYSIEPDLDSIFAEVDAGLLESDFVDSYVKVTPVITLRCN